jgi:hypothetical protein
MFRIAEVRHKRLYGCRKKRLKPKRFFDNHYKGTQINGQAKMKPPVKSLLLFISKSQAPGWTPSGLNISRLKLKQKRFV